MHAKLKTQAIDTIRNFEPVMPHETPPSPKNVVKEVELNTLIHQIEFIRQLAACDSKETFVAQISSVIQNFGFTDFSFVKVRANGSLKMSFSTLPDEFQAVYHLEKYAEIDLVLDYLKSGDCDPVFLSSITEWISASPFTTLCLQRNQAIHALLRRFGINDCYTLPISDASGRNSVMLSVMATNMSPPEFRAQTKNCEPILRLLADAIHFIDDERHYFSHVTPPTMGAKPLRLLSTMAHNDLTLAQVASKLCISLDTANKHMAIAKQCMGTHSQANAVFLAIKEGLIGLDQP